MKTFGLFVILTFVFAFLSIAMLGCQESAPSRPTPKMEPPAIPQKMPEAPVAPSSYYLKGYNDGYYGTWLAPVRWTFRDDYRAGWSVGGYDRNHNLPHRFNK